MLKSRETLLLETRDAGFSRPQQDHLANIINSVWQWKQGEQTQAKRERYVIVGGQVVKGTSADEKQSTTDGGQTTVPTTPVAGVDGSIGASGEKGAKGDAGPTGPAGPIGLTGPAGTTLHEALTDLQGGAAGDHSHLTAAQLTDLTDGLDSTAHFHSADRYTHPTGDGYLHVPATGTTNNGNVLTAGSTAGSLSWVTPTVYTDAQVDARISAQKGVANGLATLDSNSKIPLSQIPASVIVDTFVVSSQAAMLALSAAQQGDIAIRTDLNKTFVLTNNAPGTLANWQEMLTPTGLVSSVALSLPTEFSVSGSPITSSGTLTASWSSQTTGKVFAAPAASSGTPTFRALVWSDISAAISGHIPVPSSTTPAALGTATVGTGTTWARADHVHAMPTAAQIGLTGWATKAYTNGSTTDVAEGTNLYYTDARARAACTPEAIGAAPVTSLAGYLPLSGGNLTGNLRPNASNSYELGSTSLRWANVYGINGDFVNLSVGTATAGSFVRSGGTAYQYLRGDGSVYTSANSNGVSRLYRNDAAYTSRYYVYHTWEETNPLGGNVWRIRAANDEGDSQAGIYTTMVDYCDLAKDSQKLGGVVADNFVQGSGQGLYGHRTTNVSTFDTLLKSGFYDSSSAATGPFGATWTHLIRSTYTDPTNAQAFWSFDIAAAFITGNTENYAVRTNTEHAWGAWRTLWHDGNLQFAGTGTESTMARSDHNHSTAYHPLNGALNLGISASQLTLDSVSGAVTVGYGASTGWGIKQNSMSMMSREYGYFILGDLTSSFCNNGFELRSSTSIKARTGGVSTTESFGFYYGSESPSVWITPYDGRLETTGTITCPFINVGGLDVTGFIHVKCTNPSSTATTAATATVLSDGFNRIAGNPTLYSFALPTPTSGRMIRVYVTDSGSAYKAKIWGGVDGTTFIGKDDGSLATSILVSTKAGITFIAYESMWYMV